MKNHVLVDIDDTLSRAAWRTDFIASAGWDAFHAKGVNDEPALELLAFISAYNLMNFKIVLITGRPDRFRPSTLGWLLRHNVPVHHLLMRPDKDFRPTPEMKLALATEHFGSLDALKAACALYIDDHDGNIAAFAGLGITTLQVRLAQ